MKTLKSLVWISGVFLISTAAFAQATLTSTPASLDEGNLEGAVITITLSSETFIDNTTGDFTLNNEPSGLSISGGITLNGDSTEASFLLQFSGDFDYDITDFSVTVDRNSHSGSSDITTGDVTITATYEKPAATMVGSGGEYCVGDSYDIRINLSQGETPWTFKYTIDGGSEQSVSTSSNPYTLSVNSPGTYALTEIKDNNDTIGIHSGSNVVIENPLPTPTVTGDAAPCEGTVQVYHVTPTVGSTFSWTIDTNDGNIVGATDRDSVVADWVFNHTAAWVEVAETTNKGCVDTDRLNISFAAGGSKPTIKSYVGAVEGTVDEFCEGGSLPLRSDTYNSNGYLWSTSATTRNITVSNSVNLTLQFKASNGCYGEPSDVYAVTENPKPRVSVFFLGADNELCVNEPGKFRITKTAGTNPVNIDYDLIDINGTTSSSATISSGSSTDVNISPSDTGILSIDITTIADANCTDGVATPSIESVHVNSLPDIDFTPDRTDFANSEDPVDLEATPVGGTFSGQGVSEGKFYPALADTTTPNPVTYSYTDAIGCQNDTTVEFNVIVAQGDIVADNAYDNGSGKLIYCFSAAPDQLTGSSVTGNPGGTFSGPGITNIGNDKATFDPQLAGAGEHQVAYIYTITFYIVIPFPPYQIPYLFPAPPVIKIVVVDDPGVKIISGILDEYCANNDSVEVQLLGAINNEGVPGFEGLESMSGPGISQPNPGEFWFNPQKGGTGPRMIAYNYTRDFSQCQINTQKAMTVHPLPQLGFEVKDSCILTTAGTDSVRFYNLSPDSLNMVAWLWNFGDGFIDTRQDPWHDYNSEGSKLISLAGTDINNCTDRTEQIIEFGAITPSAFEWEKECFGDITEFTFIGNASKVVTYDWDFDDGTTESIIVDNIDHEYAGPGNYFVDLLVINDFGCKDSLVQRVPIRPTVILDPLTPYMEDFENGDGGWVAEPNLDLNPAGIMSWELGPLAGTIIQDPAAGNVWATSLAGLYVDNEKSFVQGPCFDFTASEKPMIKLKYWTHTENQRDGTVIQTSIDDGNSWQVLGSNEDGIEWYDYALLTGEPGGQRLGWTGTGQTSWNEARNLLDHLKGQKVRIKVAFGADAVASNFEGFAFDDVWIGERSRVVALEHFTNESVQASLDADTMVNFTAALRSDEVIDIHYHTSFPGPDSRNTYYPAGPSSRSLYYGISEVPRSVMGGIEYFEGLDPNNSAYAWQRNDLEKRILVDPNVTIDLLQSTLAGPSLTARAELELSGPDWVDENLTLHMVVIENESTQFQGTLRKMLPNTGGTSLINLWDGNMKASTASTWNFNPADFVSIDSLVLVAFIQDEADKEILQSSYLRFSDMLGTGIFKGTAEIENAFTIVPNPANAIIKIQRLSENQEDFTYYIINEVGKKVMEGRITDGSVKQVSIVQLDPGIYFVNLRGESGSTHYLKFVKMR